MCLLTQEGLNDVIKTRDGLVKRIQTQRAELFDMQSTKVPESGSSASENADNEHAEDWRQISIDEQNVLKLNDTIMKATVVPFATNTNVVDIGTIVTLQRYDEDQRPIGAEAKYYIGGYESNDPTACPPILSYTAPILRPFFKQRASECECAEIYLNGKLFYVELKNIELPEKIVPFERKAS